MIKFCASILLVIEKSLFFDITKSSVMMESVLIASETFETSLCWNSDSEVTPRTSEKSSARQPRSHSASVGGSPRVSSRTLCSNTIHGSLTRTKKSRGRLRTIGKSSANSSPAHAAPTAYTGELNGVNHNPGEKSSGKETRDPGPCVSLSSVPTVTTTLAVQSLPNTPVKKVPLSRRTRERLHAALRSSVPGSPRHKTSGGTSSSAGSSSLGRISLFNIIYSLK